MGYRSSIAALMLAWSIAGCGQASDPAVPCPAQDLAIAARSAPLSAHEGPLLALSQAPAPLALFAACADGPPCTPVAVPLPALGAPEGRPDNLTPGSPLLISGRGHYIVALDQGDLSLRRWRVEGQQIRPMGRAAVEATSPRTLVASLRDSDKLLVRDARGQLGVLDPASPTAEVMLLAPTFPDMRAVALGTRYVVGREWVDGDTERLILAPVDPEHSSLVEGIALMEADAFSRIELTPDEKRLVATSGRGDEAETFVFAIPQGQLVDRFVGAAVTGAVELDAVPGLQATSPDGTHLAYRTPSGALALRNLEVGGACLIRSASAGDHQVAGFSAGGVLYFQADEGDEDRVFAFTTQDQRLHALDLGLGGHKLAAVSATQDGAAPWAIGVKNGSYARIAGQSESLGVQEALFDPRTDGMVWVTELQRESYRTHLAVRGVHSAADTHENDHTTLKTEVDTQRPPCLALGMAGRWARECGRGSTQGLALGVGSVPASEDPREPIPSEQPTEALDGTTGGDSDGRDTEDTDSFGDTDGVGLFGEPDQQPQ